MNGGRTHTKLVLVLIVLATAVVAVGVALATPPEGGFVATLLNRGANPDEVKVHTDLIKFKTRGPTDIIMVTVTWQPGAHAGWHSHSGLIFFTLKSGTVSVFDGNCNAR